LQLPHAVDFEPFLLQLLPFDLDLSQGLFFFAPDILDIVLLQLGQLGLLCLKLH